MWIQNGTTEEVKKIVSTLNEGQVPPPDVVGKWTHGNCCVVLLFKCLYSWYYCASFHAVLILGRSKITLVKVIKKRVTENMTLDRIKWRKRIHVSDPN